MGLICIICAFYACTTSSETQAITGSQAMPVDSTQGSCAYFTKDNHNNIVLSWIKQVDSLNAMYCYAVSKDGGKTFTNAVEIPGSNNLHPHGENMPKIIFKPSGEIIAAWGAANPNPNNAYAGLVYYSQSFDAGKTWTKPRLVTSDTASYDQRYFDMALLPNGEAAIVWLDNRKQWKGEGSGLYYAVTKNKDGFVNERLISGPCCQCCRTDLFVDHDKNIHVVYRAIIDDSIRDMVHIVSSDAGNTFSKAKQISKDNWVINGCPHTGPAIAENKLGLHFAWFTGGKNAGIYYNTSTDNGNTFTMRDTVSGKASMHCQLATLPDDNILITWNETFAGNGKYNSRIGIEERDAHGKTLIKNYVTSANGNASFPVIYAVDNTKAVIAYTETMNNKSMVFYKQVLLR